MKHIDWHYLRGAIAVFVVVSAAAGALAWVTQRYHHKVNEAFFERERDFSVAKRRYDEARRNRAVYQRYLSEYRHYMDKGLIGREQRLSWIEQLQRLNEQYKLASMNYEISPQEPADLPAIDVPAGITLSVSTMDLQAGLLHEGDAVALWKEFRNQASGFYAIRECELESMNGAREAAPEYRPYTANVNMHCQLDWYTIKVGDS